jgi:hypothetical protein
MTFREPSLEKLRSSAHTMALISNLDWRLADHEVLRQPGWAGRPIYERKVFYCHAAKIN